MTVFVKLSAQSFKLSLLFACRFEIEKKLRQQKRLERAKDKPFVKPKDKDKKENKEKEKEKVKEKPKPKEVEKEEEKDTSNLQIDFSSIDHKERSKERKKNIEENRGKAENKRQVFI